MAVHLARLSGVDEIVLIDRDARFARGVAYATTDDCHRLNVPAERMGGRDPDDRAGFVTWLAGQGWHDTGDFAGSFVPRARYGDYLAAELAAVAATGRLRQVQDTVLAIAPQPDGHAVRTASGSVIRADTVVLCLGNPPPAALRGAEASPRLVPDVWAPGALDGIGAGDDVAVIGTGATAIDAVLALVARGAGTRIRMISRHGRLPLVDVPAAPCPPPDGIGAGTVRGLMRELRAAVAAGTAGGLPWQAVFDAFRTRATELWLSLPDAERRRFLRHLRAPWMVHRHRLAPDIARQIAGLQAEGRVEILRARVLGGAPADGGYALRLRPSGSAPAQPETLHAGWVLNCTGPDETYARASSPLVQALLADGLARPGPFGLGLDCDAGHRLIDAAGTARPGLFLVGPPTRGRFWEVTSAPSGRDQCLAVAQLIAASAPVPAPSAP